MCVLLGFYRCNYLPKDETSFSFDGELKNVSVSIEAFHRPNSGINNLILSLNTSKNEPLHYFGLKVFMGLHNTRRRSCLYCELQNRALISVYLKLLI